jgi:hypothetical protein
VVVEADHAVFADGQDVRRSDNLAVIGPQVHGEDQWQFHNVDKQYIKEMVSSPDPWSKLELLKQMVIPDKTTYLANSGEGEPPNWRLLLELKKRFMYEYTKWGPSLTERLIMDKVWNMFLLLYKQDTAYFERIGGALTAMLANKDAFRNKRDRLAALMKLRDWWDENDARESKRPLINSIFMMVINGYQNKPFVEKAVDWTLEMFFALEKEEAYNWKIVDQFDPNNWFPSKRCGGINYVILGRDQ